VTSINCDKYKQMPKTYKNPTSPTCVGATIHGYFYSSKHKTSP